MLSNYVKQWNCGRPFATVYREKNCQGFAAVCITLSHAKQAHINKIILDALSAVNLLHLNV